MAPLFAQEEMLSGVGDHDRLERRDGVLAVGVDSGISRLDAHGSAMPKRLLGCPLCTT